MPDNPKRAALIAEGMSEGEADFMLSGGTKDEGLTPPEDAGGTPQADSGQTSPQPQPPQAGAAPPQPAAAAPAVPPAAEEEDGPDVQEGKPVPYQAFIRWKKRAKEAADQLKSEREGRSTAETALNAERDRMARLGERLANLASEPAAAPAPEPVKPPDPEADPIGYLKYLGEQVTGLAGKTTETTEQIAQRDAAQQLERDYVASAQTFARTQRDFGGAYDFLLRNRDAELAAAGYSDPAERARIIALDERDIVARALEAQKRNPQAPSPAAVIYNLSRARGWQVPAAQPGAAATNGAATNGATPPAAAAPAPAAPAATVTAQVEAIQRGQAASRSLSSGGGAPAPQGIDLARIADMTDQEYQDFKRSLTPQQAAELRAMIGAPSAA